MELKIKERLLLGSLYPEKSDLLKQLVIKDIIRKTEITPEEAEKLELKNDGGKIVWNSAKDVPVEIDLSDSEVNFLKDQVARLDTAGEITQNIVELCLYIKDYKKPNKEDRAKKLEE